LFCSPPQPQQSHPKLNCFTRQLLNRMVRYATNNKLLLLELFKMLGTNNKIKKKVCFGWMRVQLGILFISN
jgi:hypothetical protein